MQFSDIEMINHMIISLTNYWCHFYLYLCILFTRSIGFVWNVDFFFQWLTVEQEKAVEEGKKKMLFHSLFLFNSQPLKQSTFSVMNKSRFVLMDVMDLTVISYVIISILYPWYELLSCPSITSFRLDQYIITSYCTIH